MLKLEPSTSLYLHFPTTQQQVIMTTLKKRLKQWLLKRVFFKHFCNSFFTAETFTQGSAILTNFGMKIQMKLILAIFKQWTANLALF